MTFGREKRREARVKVALPATLRYGRSQTAVLLLDVSSGGVMLRADAPPPRGEEVLLIRGALEVVATVAWVEDRHCGLYFHRPVAKQALIDAKMQHS